jgi:putative copper export protein
MPTYALVLSLHLLAACVWTGGHLVLALSVLPRALRRRDPAVIAQYEALFERVGLPALLVQVLSGLWLAHFRIEDLSLWFDFSVPYARPIGYKLILLAATVLLALHARLRILPRLDAERLPLLAVHIVAVTAIGVLFVLVGMNLRLGLGW